MVFFNHATRQMTTKIVYYGPGLCGKTTNLNTIYGRTSQKARGEMVSLNTETDRTLFFDLLPMDVGMVGGFKTKLQLYTVPGQVFYNSTRKLVLKGVDGIVFVADSQTPMLDANKESLQNLKDNLRELGLDLKDIPLIFQWNKRDLKNIVPVETLERELNPDGKVSFQSIAADGTGVFETLRGITRLALAHIKALHMAEASAPKGKAPVALSAADVAVPEDLAEPPPAPAPAPAPLATTDLGAPTDLFEDAPTASGLPVPAARTAAAPAPVQVMAPLRVKVPKAGAPVPKVVLKPLPTPGAAKPAPVRPVAAKPAAPRPTPARHPADLHLELSPFVLDGEVEIVVTVRQNGVDVGTGEVLHPAPAWGSAQVLTVELRRS